MVKKYQITIKDTMIGEYPTVSKVLETLSGAERAKTLMAACEAFATIEKMQYSDPEAIYFHAKAILKGYDPEHTRITVQQPDNNETASNTGATFGNQPDSDLLDRVSRIVDQF